MTMITWSWLIETSVMLLLFRFWQIVYQRRIYREMMNAFPYELLTDAFLIVLYVLHIGCMYEQATDSGGHWLTAKALLFFAAFMLLMMRKADRLGMEGIVNARNASKYKEVLDGIEIKKRFKEYMKTEQAKGGAR